MSTHLIAAFALTLVLSSAVPATAAQSCRRELDPLNLTASDREDMAQQALAMAFSSPDARTWYGADCPPSTPSDATPCTVYVWLNGLERLRPPIVRGIRFVTLTHAPQTSPERAYIRYLCVSNFEPTEGGVVVCLVVANQHGLIGSASLFYYQFRPRDGHWIGKPTIAPLLKERHRDKQPN
jgi:hypothetical protein